MPSDQRGWHLPEADLTLPKGRQAVISCQTGGFGLCDAVNMQRRR